MPATDAKVVEDLKNAFAGESQANRKYLAFAQKADREGHPFAAKAFRAAAEAETIHAHSHLSLLDGVKSTADNLKEAIGGETFEFTKMYPEMIQHAKDAKDAHSERDFHLANEAEKVHAELFKKAAENMGKPAPALFVCKVCGYIAEGAVPETCPICGGKHQVFFEVK
ncbi:MAG: rubrerythrin family protein [Deltaproteobacteria bacterium]|jgi:rubrerythrin|nr:rubrerythrin family protein [Deltaproteobacteria bacterium]